MSSDKKGMVRQRLEKLLSYWAKNAMWTPTPGMLLCQASLLALSSSSMSGSSGSANTRAELSFCHLEAYLRPEMVIVRKCMSAQEGNATVIE